LFNEQLEKVAGKDWQSQRNADVRLRNNALDRHVFGLEVADMLNCFLAPDESLSFKRNDLEKPTAS
jgi:hypothetical protein